MVPLIDRELFKDRQGKDRGHSSTNIVFSAALAVVMVVGAFAGLMALVADNGVPQPSGPPAKVPARVSYTIHSPISINGNAEFTTENGVSGGDGSISDPYVIADWDINASSADGIQIWNADVHFIIRNCYVQSGGSYSGIFLYNCANGTVEYNTCSNMYYGIAVSDSQNITVVGNNCSSNEAVGIVVGGYSSRHNTLYDNICNFNQDGIFINGASNNTLINNTCVSNSYEGVYLYEANNNTLTGNTCTLGNAAMEIILSFGNILADNNLSSNSGGTYVWDSGDNTLVNNTFNFDGFVGLFLIDSTNNTLSGNTCSNNDIGIYLSYSSNNTLVSNTCSNYIAGIELDSSSNNTLDSNNCSSNGQWGIQIRYSIGNVVLRNQLCDNLAYGIYVDIDCSSNLIFNNTLIGNNGAGSTYDPIHVQAYDYGPDNWWNSSEGYGNYWSDWTTPDLVPPYGIVDQPYVIDGGGGTPDFYPQTTPQLPIPEFGVFPLVVIALLAMMVLIRERRREKA